jgi:ABC-type lipoprotein export system ATPase subunit
MISLRKVTKDYIVDEEATITPVRHISLDIAEGEFVIIVGRSGSGKSTLLNLTAGLIRPTSGDILIADTNISNMADREISELRSRKIGFVFQFPSLLPSLTIFENVTMPSGFASRNHRNASAERADNLLKLMGLGGRMNLYPRHLSAGEQKRAVIARALVNEPSILLADEPTSDLDEQTELEVMRMLKDIHQKGVTIMMVTHSLNLIPFSNRAFKMENGALTPVAREAAATGRR